MTLYDLEARVERPKRKQIRNRDGFACRCPSCASRGEDNAGANGSAFEGEDGWLHPHCQKGCSQLDFMGALGLTDEDRRIAPLDPASPERPPKPRNVVYRYVTGKGKLLFTKERYYVWDDRRGAWKKLFCFKTPPSAANPQGRGDLQELGQKAYVLYNLPDIARAKDEGLTVHVGEGEKAADALRAAGLVATCTHIGATSGDSLHTRWTPAHTKQLAGVKRVVVWCDRDAPNDRGRVVSEDWASYVAEQLLQVVDSVEIVQSATLGAKDDAFDHLAAGHSVEDAAPRRDLLPDEDEAGIEVFGDDFAPPSVEWLVEDYLLAGKMTLLDGRRATGKSTLALQWAAALSRGVHPFFVNNEAGCVSPVSLPCGPIRTLYVHRGEDENAECELVYRENGGVPGRIVFFKDLVLKLDESGITRIRRMIIKHRIKLVILDNLIYFLSSTVKSINNADEVGPVMMRLNAVASETGAAFLNLRHMVKSGGEKEDEKRDPSESGLGSVIIASGHRGQLVLQQFPARLGVTFATPERGTILTQKGDPFAFRKIGLEIQYLPNEESPRDKTPPAERIGQLSKAKDVLRALLDGGREVAAKEIERAIAESGVSYKTYRLARTQLGMKPRKQCGTSDGKTLWSMPASSLFDEASRDPYERPRLKKLHFNLPINLPNLPINGQVGFKPALAMGKLGARLMGKSPDAALLRSLGDNMGKLGKLGSNPLSPWASWASCVALRVCYSPVAPRSATAPEWKKGERGSVVRTFVPTTRRPRRPFRRSA